MGKLSREKLRKLINETIENISDNSTLDDVDMMSSRDTYTSPDMDLVMKAIRILEDHNHSVRFDGTYLITAEPYYDTKTGKTETEIKRFNVYVQPRTLISNIKRWLGY